MGASRKSSRASPADSLTAKQKLFVAEYVANGLNATQAAIAAGYPRSSARQQGSENLSKPDIKAAIARLLKPRLDKLELTAERVDQELARVAFFDPRRLFDGENRLIPIAELPEDVSRALASLEVEATYSWVDDPLSPGMKKRRAESGTITKVRLLPKVEALGLAYRRLRLLNDTGAGGLTVKRLVVNINGVRRGA